MTGRVAAAAAQAIATAQDQGDFVQMDFGGYTGMLCDAYPEYGIRAPRPGAGTSITLHVDDADALIAQAVAAGATLERSASSKPNLLNVAATRAERRFYIVGERAVWGSQRYFDQARNMLPVVTAGEFLERCEGAEPVG